MFARRIPEYCLPNRYILPSGMDTVVLDSAICGTSFMDISRELDEFMKVHTINLAEMDLKRFGKRLLRSKVAVIDLAYKKDIYDARESPFIGTMDEWTSQGLTSLFATPNIRSIRTKTDINNFEKSLGHTLKGSDRVPFLVSHYEFVIQSLERLMSLMEDLVIIDCRSIFGAEPSGHHYTIGKANK